MLIDTHCHLEDEKFSNDLREVIDRAKNVGVERIINFGSTMETSIAVTDLSENFEELYAGVGIHPSEIDSFDEKTLDALADLAAHKKVIAIGEIGLDYHWEKDSERRLSQQKIFVELLDLARQLNLPICVHDREAHSDTLKILQTEGRGLRGVLHCYSGSVEVAREIFKLDWFIGVDGPLTFKNSAKLPEVIQIAPRDRILLETDAPYLAPTPYRGTRNEPAYLIEIAKKIAEVRNETLDEVVDYTSSNAIELYNLK